MGSLSDKPTVSGTSEPLDPEIERLLALILRANRRGEPVQAEQGLALAGHPGAGANAGGHSPLQATGERCD